MRVEHLQKMKQLSSKLKCERPSLLSNAKETQMPGFRLGAMSSAALFSSSSSLALKHPGLSASSANSRFFHIISFRSRSRFSIRFTNASVHCFASMAAMSGIERIKVQNPVVKMDGLFWRLNGEGHMVDGERQAYICKYLDFNIKYYDLGILNRDATDDKVTVEAALATLKLKETICIGKHASGDQYHATETIIKGPGKLKMVFVPTEGGMPMEVNVHDFKGPGIALAMFNVDESIRAFAGSSMSMAFKKKRSLYLSAKNTILKMYDGQITGISNINLAQDLQIWVDHRFKDIFQEVYKGKWKHKFEEQSI